MKKYINKLFLVAAIIGVSTQSCTDLEEELYDQVALEDFFKTPEEVTSALGAAYTNLYGFGGNGNIYPAQEVTSDELVVPVRGNDWADGGAWTNLHQHTYNAETPNVGNTWNFLYNGVNTCNRLLFQLEPLEIDGKDALIAEIKTFRALYYYWLLDIFGNVPIVDRFDVPADYAPAKSSRQEVYNFVESELLANVPLLSKNVDNTTYARVNYYVGQMIMAKLYLNAEVYTGKGEWAKAAAACDEIINSGKYSLTENYFRNFSATNENSPEFIFAIPYDQVFAKGFNIGMMTLHYQSQFTYNLTQQPWNGFCSLQEFYESYEENDVRRGSFLVGPQYSSSGELLEDPAAEAGDPDGKPLNFTPEITDLFNAYRQAGARVGKFEFALGATDNLSNDFPVYRYADVLLMKAEALWRQGNGGGEALNLVNQIRARAGVEPFTSLNADNLLAERGRELFSEVHRRTDLIRFGKYNDPWWAKPASDPHVNIYPIPRAQLDNNKNLVQNPGYN